MTHCIGNEVSLAYHLKSLQKGVSVLNDISKLYNYRFSRLAVDSNIFSLF